MARRNPKGMGDRPHKWRGLWRIRVTVGYDGQGRQVRKAVTAKTQKECIEKAEALKRDLHTGLLRTDKAPTVEEFCQHWLRVKAGELQPSSIRAYTYELGYLYPHIGRQGLDKLTAVHISNAQLEIAAQHSARAAHHAIGRLKSALNDAVRWNVISRSPAASIRKVKYKAQTFKIWTADEVMRFSAAAKPCQFYPLFYVGLTTGLRLGELIALEWGDLEGNKLHVQRTAKLIGTKLEIGDLKSSYSNRVLTLGPDTVDLLERQRAILSPYTPLAFPSQNLTHAGYSNLRRALHTWGDKAGCKRIRPHDLRHTYASMRIAQGTDPVTLSRELGHHSPAFTMNHYAHLFELHRPKAAPTLMQLAGYETTKEEARGDVAESPN